MNGLRYAVAAGVLAMTVTTVRAGDEVIAPGDPPLTRSVADRKIDFWQCAFGQQLDDRQRAELRQLQAREWVLRDRDWKLRWVHFLDVWQAAGGPASERLRAGACLSARESLGRDDADAVGTWLLARSAANNRDVVAMQVLLHQQAEREQLMRMMSDAQARHHELMMTIIRNVGPSGRYVYNGSTGRYDWVPYP
jgi:hypothetical protein